MQEAVSGNDKLGDVSDGPVQLQMNGVSGDPAFIRLSDPPPFDITRHLPFIRAQLPPDQLANIEAALAVDPHLFDKSATKDLILDCAAEESFTLETFGALLKAARVADKDFIIARVTTLDPTGTRPQLYHSHYSAHHLNKILFRTQPEEGLLHRMKSRNPLNNMLIVGDVDYFVVRPADHDAAQSRFRIMCHSKSNGREEGKVDNAGIKSHETDDISVGIKSHETGSDNADFKSALSASMTLSEREQRPSGIDGQIAAANETLTPATTIASLGSNLFSGLLQRKRSQVAAGINVAPFENAKEFTSPNQSTQDLSPQLRTSRNASSSSLARSTSLNSLPEDGEPAVLYDAHAFATDDDFLMRADVREYFKANSVNPDDYLLFTLYRNAAPEGGPYMTEIPVTGFTSVPVPDAATLPPAPRVKSWRNCWGLFYPPSPSISTLRTGVISRAAFKYILVLYIVVCILALVFVVPLELSYFVGFGMFVVILLVTVFLVECNPSAQGAGRWNLFTYRQRMQQQHENATAAANITSSSSVVGRNSAAASSSTALNQV